VKGVRPWGLFTQGTEGTGEGFTPMT
jgi:hypothetical protein